MFKLIKISPEHHDMLKEYSQKKHRTMKGTLEKWIEEKYETIKSSYGVKLRADGKRE